VIQYAGTTCRVAPVAGIWQCVAGNCGSALRVPATVLRFPQMAVGCAVANKENKATVNNKKVGKSPKEKKAAKAAKNEERTAERKAWEK
jgi:hypothetical protein